MVVSAETVQPAPILFVTLENNPDKFSLLLEIESSTTLVDAIYANSSLSKVIIKDALNKGAAQVKRKKSKWKRTRKAKFLLSPEDKVKFYYDKQLIQATPPKPVLLHDKHSYSVWYKPKKILTQGTEFGDHCSMSRQIELNFANRKIYIVHRLDFDVDGIMLFAHTKKHAGYFSELFKRNKIKKKYYARVNGIPESSNEIQKIEYKLDGKKASTLYRVIQHSSLNQSLLDITLETGRKHQIRKHLKKIGHPVIGDKIYGFGKRNDQILLTSYLLEFFCPESKKVQKFTLPEEYIDPKLRKSIHGI